MSSSSRKLALDAEMGTCLCGRTVPHSELTHRYHGERPLTLEELENPLPRNLEDEDFEEEKLRIEEFDRI